MSIKPINKITPLREDLQKIVPNKFYVSTEYKRWTITSGMSDIWGQALLKAERSLSYYVIYGDSEVTYASEAMTLLLNHFYVKDHQALMFLLIGTLQTYCETNRTTIDTTCIRLDLQAAEIDNSLISQLDIIKGDTLDIPIKEYVSEEQRVRDLEKKYKILSDKSTNSRDAVDAYIEWHSSAVLYLSEYYTITNADFKQFKEIDNSHNGYGLRTNFLSLYSIYNLLMTNAVKQVKQTLSSSKTPMVFISHSSADKTFVEALVSLFEDLGMTSDNLFCSSIPEYGIGISQNIFNVLRSLFLEHDLFVIFVHSPRYYDSSVSLNEMGAAWVLRTNFCSFLTTDMDFSNMNGVINGNAISIKVNTEDATARLNELKNILIKTLSLPAIEENKWERKRNNFIKLVNSIVYSEKEKIQESSSVDEEYKQLQIERMKQEEAERKRGCIRGNIIQGIKAGNRTLKIFNSGKAEARNVKVEWLNKTTDVIVRGNFSEIGSLTPQNSRSFHILLTMGHPEVMKLRYSWEDDYSANNTLEEQVQL